MQEKRESRLQIQTYNHKLHGLINFQDKKQNFHSQKVFPKDLMIMASKFSHDEIAEIKRDLSAEINKQKQPDAESGIGRNKQ